MVFSIAIALAMLQPEREVQVTPRVFLTLDTLPQIRRKGRVRIRLFTQTPVARSGHKKQKAE